MCGLAGFIGGGGHDDLQRMLDRIVHRGPDGEGAFVDRERGVSLGHRRLAILDIAGGHQPMWNEDETVGVIFNGEIYNHAELRAALIARGHRFRSDHSDTEVLVHGHEEWGAGLPARLNGMFAYAIIDRSAGRLILARDRFGEKPVFWAERPGCFLFASELPALLAHSALADAVLESRALQKFFGYGFLPAPWTPYRGVHKLPAGHWLTVDLRTRAVRTGCFWQFSLIPDDAPPGGEDDWAAEIDRLLSASVRARLQSDVPLGLFLSGGLDSSGVLSCAADAMPASSIQAFSIGFHEASFDESAPARRMAAHVGVRHHLEICELEKARELIPDLLRRVGEPMGDSSILPTYLLCHFARRSVTVALSGDGGDELFAGYDPFKALDLARHYHRLVPRPVHHAVAAVAARLPPSERNMSFDFKLNRALRGLGFPPRLWNPVWLSALAPRDIAELFRTPIAPDELYAEAIALWDRCASPSLVDRTLEFYTNLYLPDDILVKTDRASMLNSLELRAPFLDNALVEFARRLPTGVKFRQGQGKWILKRALRHRLPPDILARPKKGFGIPLARWLRQMPPPGDKPPLDALDESWLSRRWREHAQRRGDHRAALWCWLSLRQCLPALP